MNEKVWSGRFLWTVGALLVWGFLAVTGALPADQNIGIIMLVVYAYFQRPDRLRGSPA